MTSPVTNGRNLIRVSQDYCKYLLTLMGAFLSANVIYILNASINYLEVGRWMRAKGYVIGRRFARREELFDIVSQE
jgi:hypothetical protein